MAPPQPPLPRTAKPHHSTHFDPWNSSSAGHQIAENRPVASLTGWRRPHAMKLNHQYRSGSRGGPRIADPSVIAISSPDGTEGWKTRLEGGEKVRARRTTVMDMLRYKIPAPSPTETSATIRAGAVSEISSTSASKASTAERKIFTGCTVYINGSTQPLISDHKLKQLLAENGARLSMHLGRRQVTHVILGKPCVASKALGGNGAGIGGGMAAGKIEREIRRVGGCGVRYVGVEWVLESIGRGIRQPEAAFAVLGVASKGQRTVYDRSRVASGRSSGVSRAATEPSGDSFE